MFYGEKTNFLVNFTAASIVAHGLGLANFAQKRQRYQPALSIRSNLKHLRPIEPIDRPH